MIDIIIQNKKISKIMILNIRSKNLKIRGKNQTTYISKRREYMINLRIDAHLITRLELPPTAYVFFYKCNSKIQAQGQYNVGKKRE